MKKFLLFAVALIATFGLNAQVFSDDFQTDTTASGWTTYTPTWDAINSPYKWHIAEYSGDYYLSASDWDGENHTSEQWISSPSFDASAYTSLSITFDNRKRYAPYQDLELYVSSDFAGDSASFASATWTQITGLTLDSDDSDYDWATSTNDISSIAGASSAYIAFKYVSTDDAGGNWTVNNIVITGAASVNSVYKPVLSLYPNPTSDVIYFNVNSTNNNVQILNTVGQVVLSAQNVRNSVNVATLPQGVYTVIIENENGRIAKKFVKR